MYGEYEWRDLPVDRPVRQERTMDEAVLACVLTEHPVHWAIAELVREMSGGGGVHDEGELVEEAICRLIAVGLLHRHGHFVLPTRAALRFDELVE